LPIRDLQGSRDDPRMLKNLRLAFARLDKLGADNAELIEFPELAHDFEFGAVDWKTFFGAAVRDPRPAKIARCCANKSETRAFWVDVLQWKTAVQEEFRPRISASRWQRADEDARRGIIQGEVDKHTARLEIVDHDGGRFVAHGAHVTRFRILLTSAMVGDKGRVEVVFGAKKKRATIVPNAKTLLLEFVERFDRTFLPTAELIVP